MARITAALEWRSKEPFQLFISSHSGFVCVEEARLDHLGRQGPPLAPCTGQAQETTDDNGPQTDARDPSDIPQARRDHPRSRFCSFLALVLKKVLDDRIVASAAQAPGPRSSPISTR